MHKKPQLKFFFCLFYSIFQALQVLSQKNFLIPALKSLNYWFNRFDGGLVSMEIIHIFFMRNQNLKLQLFLLFILLFQF